MTQKEQNYQAWMGWGAAAPSLPLPSLSPLPDPQTKTRGRKITVVSISRNLFLPSAKCTAAASASSSLFLLSSRCALPSLITSQSEEWRAASSWSRAVRRHVGDVRTWRGQTRELQTVILLQMVPSHDKEPDIIHYTHLNITKHFNQLYPSISTLQSTCTCQERKRGGEKKKEDKGYERRRGVARSDANPTRFRSSAALCDWKKLARSEVIYFLDGGGWRIICEERSWRWRWEDCEGLLTYPRLTELPKH